MSHHCGRPDDGTRIWQAADGVHIDVRGLDSPEPTIRLLALIDASEVGTAVIAHLDREPIFLYPELDDRGWDHEIIATGHEHAGCEDEIKLRLVRFA
jgi:hypothetical protein